MKSEERGERAIPSPQSPDITKIGDLKSLSVSDDFKGCMVFAKSYKEFLRLNGRGYPYRLRANYLINFHEPKIENIAWTHTLTIPLYPDGSQDYVTYTKVVIICVDALTRDNMDSIIKYALSCKTRAISGNDHKAVRDQDIILIYRTCQLTLNLKFEQAVRKRSEYGHRGCMTFAMSQGPEFIERTIMDILGKWLQVSAERLTENMEKKKIELFGNLKECHRFVSDLGDYLIREQVQIHVPMKIPTTSKLKKKPEPIPKPISEPIPEPDREKLLNKRYLERQAQLQRKQKADIVNVSRDQDPMRRRTGDRSYMKIVRE